MGRGSFAFPDRPGVAGNPFARRNAVPFRRQNRRGEGVGGPFLGKKCHFKPVLGQKW